AEHRNRYTTEAEARKGRKLKTEHPWKTLNHYPLVHVVRNVDHVDYAKTSVNASYNISAERTRPLIITGAFNIDSSRPNNAWSLYCVKDSLNVNRASKDLAATFRTAGI
ncbi:hypothetical protein KFY46_26495, partial [Salmonella enterica subsp. enterica serovar 1,4,[5],12:i:-]|nr:hypothetical protein [Salmonella enterica subsp. enterica serovar 1,4,[5],12:i:-]